MEQTKLTPEQIKELWEECGVKPEFDLGELIDSEVEVYHWPPADLNNLGKWAWPKLLERLSQGNPLEDAQLFALGWAFAKWSDKVRLGYSLKDALALICWEVLCK